MNEELVALIDQAINLCIGRDIVPSGEIGDLLLDMRIILMKEAQEQKVEA